MILSQNINIRFKALIQGIGCFVLIAFLTGCQAVDPDLLTEMIQVKKENCWPCTGYKVVWEALSNLTQNAFPKACEWALNVLGVALLFWIAFTVGKFVVALKEPNVKEFITTMATVLFKAMVVGAILLTPDNTMSVLDIVATPVLAGIVDLARGIMFADSDIAKYFSAASTYDPISTSSTLFSSDIGNQLQDIVYRIYLAFSSGIGLGARMLISMDMLSWGLGLFVMFVFFYLMLIVPLLFMETFIIIGIVFVMFPFFLVSYVFPSTKQFMKVAWDAIFVAVLQILITAVYLTVLIYVVKIYSGNFSIGKQMTDVMLLTGLKSMTTSALAFFALIYCMFKMTNDIPMITSFLANAGVNRSQILKFAQSFTSLATNAGKFIAGAAMVGTGVGSGMGSALMADSARGVAKSMRGGIFGMEGAGTADASGTTDQMRAQAGATPPPKK